MQLWVLVGILLASSAQIQCALDSGLAFDPKELTLDSIIDNANILDEEDIAERQFSGPTLAFITPWNNKGYDIAKAAAKVITHVSPVWFQAKPNDIKGKLTCKIEGSHDIDRGWIEKLRENNGNIKIVPRIIFEGWEDRIKDFLHDSAAQDRCALDVLAFYQRNQFDGAVIEFFTPMLFASLSIHNKPFVMEAMEAITEALMTNQLEAITTISNPMDGRSQPTNFIQPKDIKQIISHSTYLQVQTYDYPPDAQAGVAPYDWIASTMEYVRQSGAEMEKVLLGLNFYGYQYKDGQFSHIINKEYLELIANKDAKIQWDKRSYEHKVSTKKTMAYYPSLSSIEMRLQLAESLKCGVGIWDLGQGLDYFMRLF